MNLVPAHRHQRSLISELADFWNSAPSTTGLSPVFGTHPLRVEDTMDDGHYVIRAEIPGVDPQNVDVSVQDGQLTIKAERSEKNEEKGRSEFNYGSFVRTVSLPKGADQNGIEASCNDGILTVSVPVAEPSSEPKKVEVKPGK